MELFDTDKLALIIGFVLPGFISVKTYALMYPSGNGLSKEQIIDAREGVEKAV